MRIILTGANGFLGKAIYHHFSAETVFRLGRTAGELIVDLEHDLPALPPADLVIHAAGKAHSVPRTPAEKEAFKNVNVAGTRRLLTTLKQADVLPKYFVFISSIAVYGLEKGTLIDENHPLAATDPYGRSKIEAEALVSAWCKENNVVCSILRLPLLAGTNPPGNLQSMIKAIKKGYYFDVNVPDVKKSMVLIDDVAVFIEQVHQLGGIFNLTDGYHPTFREISNLIAQQLHQKNAVVMPYLFIKALAFVGNFLGPKFPLNSKKLDKITNTLTFTDQKARTVAGWQPKAVLENFTI
ncbi:NAD-dependent epimerase/dehydratase family protein [Pedobacter petrophilus]|uniref:NAD-dependent epimerase/dehydratase family protein n=1 Tax=Pedobacter petrophilus TaxID=1908241 RepID=A0A7K0FZ98_9SPHI|nr:NAD-dependent epimerase/dehydratase family protein [Pedobacter petrophilus]MRX76692.1 NAD-dependent epimerase/dehydratase family protein [Pedobacter petrophilus]